MTRPRRLIFFRGPILAAVLAVSAACTPEVFPPGPGSFAAAIEDGNIIARDGARLPVRTWAPKGAAKAVLIALHGFNDYSNFFSAPGAYFARQGIISYAFDQRGFGRAPGVGLWPGVDAYIDDLRSAARAVKARHPGLPLYLLGESMGGAVIMVAMASTDPIKTAGIILAAPAVWGRETMPWYQRVALFAGSHIMPGVTVSGESLEIKPSDNIEMLRALGRDPLVIKETRIDTLYGLANLMDAALAASRRLNAPALILYGKNDQVVPKPPTQVMLSRLPRNVKGRRIAFYTDGYHMLLRDLQAETVYRDIAAWIDDNSAPLPSGADADAAALMANR
jgi:alpha-beta hydrolase superfamily lysophospholipase